MDPERTEYYTRSIVTTALGFKQNGERWTQRVRNKRKTLSTYPGPAPLLKMHSRRVTEKLNRKDYNIHL